jgi:hypothetical protein
MFGTNKLCMKGIYLPTFQRSIILRANEGYKKITVIYTVRQALEGKTCTGERRIQQIYSLTTFGGEIPQKLVSLLVSIYIIRDRQHV